MKWKRKNRGPLTSAAPGQRKPPPYKNASCTVLIVVADRIGVAVAVVMSAPTPMILLELLLMFGHHHRNNTVLKLDSPDGTERMPRSWGKRSMMVTCMRSEENEGQQKNRWQVLAVVVVPERRVLAPSGTRQGRRWHDGCCLCGICGGAVKLGCW